jgi:hypothetical protein
MKKLVLTFFATATILPAQAQLFSPESLTGAAVGAIAGGVIGHNNGRHSAEGAAIGAGVGLLAGALVRESRERSGYYDAPRVHVGGYYSTGHYHHRPYHRHSYYAPSYSSYQPYYVTPAYVQPVVTTPVVERTVIQQVAAPAPQVTIINNNYYNSAPTSPLTEANSLFGR